MFQSDEASGIIIPRFKRLILAKSGVLVSSHYLKLILEHSTQDFRSNYFDDPGKDPSFIDFIRLKLITITVFSNKLLLYLVLENTYIRLLK